MSNIHADPATYGIRFGEVIVTVDLATQDCVIHAPRPGPAMPVMRSVKFHSIDEVQGAYAAQIGLAATDPVAADIAHALKFAAQQLQGGRVK